MPARFVVDNSVVMSWCFEDEGNGYGEAVLESLESGVSLSTINDGRWGESDHGE
jgi:hypothetical protein